MFRKFDINLSPFIDCDIYHKTLRIEGRISREEALRRLHHAGVESKDIEGMYREGENSPWNAVLVSKDQACGVNSDGIKYLAKMVVDLRIHWLPLYLSDDVISEVLSPFGKVLNITRDKTLLDKDVSTWNGTRLVKLQTTEFDSRNIPHIVSLGQCGMLITMKGRAPICLKCRQSGHLRKDCPERTVSSPSYASVTNTRRNQAPQTSTPVPAVPTIPVPEPTNTSVPQAPPESQVPLEEPLVNVPSVIIEDPETSKESTEKRSELFDVDSLTWEVVRKKKRVKSNSSSEENDMDTSNNKGN